ncbi:MAG: Sua5/YciO/YrdC/YwlC family protein, partial [bacterium]|nr:Sua5/YciO/YrdC/YwlC family protein [bacterium]
MFKKDEILGFETDTVWGMGCHPLNDKAVEKIYEFKSRDKSKPLILMSSDIKNILPYIKTIPDYAKILAEKYFPGGLTLIFEKTHLCPDFVTSNF